jgi:hypothetical protein
VPMLFANQAGTVVAVDEPVVNCAMRLLGVTPEISFSTERSIVTRMTLSQQVNVQFLHTLGKQIYIYVFGDRMGQITLSGLSFLCGACDNQQALLGISPRLGAEESLRWYKRNRASRRKTPIKVAIGRETIQGFATGFTQDIVDTSISMVQWGVQITALPED